MNSKRPLVIGSVVMVGLIFSLWRCHPKEPVAAAAEPASSGLAAPASSLTVATASSRGLVAKPDQAPAPVSNGAGAERPAQPSAAPVGQAPYGSTDNAVNDVARRLDTQELALYSRVERELRRDVPKEVRDLVALRKSGATRGQLASEIQRTIPNLQLRSLLTTWLDDSFAASARPKAPLPGVAVGSGPALVKPLKVRP